MISSGFTDIVTDYNIWKQSAQERVQQQAAAEMTMILGSFLAR
jgi:hypothetical protein